MAINNAVEIEELNKLAEKVEKPEDAADVFFTQKERASYPLRIIKVKFLNASRRRKSLYKWYES